MQLGFVIDHSRCIGCHACTVACKSENDVPLGDFRTWVKYTESGSFPDVKRSFAVLRCNQCSSAPCVTICPVGALDKRRDGIVDVDSRLCIGCKGCMQACPYDALYINHSSGTAQKCHFCAHRAEVGLAPACAVVCPTEAIIPGDFHDESSVVAQMKASGELSARKPEAGTSPNVFYRDAGPAGLEPMRTNAAGGYLWAQQPEGPQLDAQEFEALEHKASARTTYDVQHAPPWSRAITTYLFTKSLAAGTFLMAGLYWLPGGADGVALGTITPGINLLAMLFLLLTTALLVVDLKRPDRFYYILTHPNWDSWITKGSFVLMGYGGLLALWLLVGSRAAGSPAVGLAMYAVTAILAGLSASYTAWLFGQAKGRPLWMKRGLAWHLLIQAGVAGAALLLIVQPLGVGPQSSVNGLRLGLTISLLLHILAVRFEGRMAPPNREEEYGRAVALMERGPLRRDHRRALAIGVLVPAVLLAIGWPVATVLAGALALAGLYLYEDVFVRAGQMLAIS